MALRTLTQFAPRRRDVCTQDNFELILATAPVLWENQRGDAWDSIGALMANNTSLLTESNIAALLRMGPTMLCGVFQMLHRLVPLKIDAFSKANFDVFVRGFLAAPDPDDRAFALRLLPLFLEANSIFATSDLLDQVLGSGVTDCATCLLPAVASFVLALPSSFACHPAIDDLMENKLKDPNSGVVSATLGWLRTFARIDVRYADMEHLKHLSTFLTHEAPAVRGAAARAINTLAQVNPTLVTPGFHAVLPLLADADNSTRQAAIDFISRHSHTMEWPSEKELEWTLQTLHRTSESWQQDQVFQALRVMVRSRPYMVL
jgi:hypothetical protein